MSKPTSNAGMILLVVGILLVGGVSLYAAEFRIKEGNNQEKSAIPTGEAARVRLSQASQTINQDVREDVREDEQQASPPRAMLSEAGCKCPAPTGAIIISDECSGADQAGACPDKTCTYLTSNLMLPHPYEPGGYSGDPIETKVACGWIEPCERCPEPPGYIPKTNCPDEAQSCSAATCTIMKYKVVAHPILGDTRVGIKGTEVPKNCKKRT